MFNSGEFVAGPRHSMEYSVAQWMGRREPALNNVAARNQWQVDTTSAAPCSFCRHPSPAGLFIRVLTWCGTIRNWLSLLLFAFCLKRAICNNMQFVTHILPQIWAQGRSIACFSSPCQAFCSHRHRCCLFSKPFWVSFNTAAHHVTPAPVQVLSGTYLMWRAARSCPTGWLYLYSIPVLLAEIAMSCMAHLFVLGMWSQLERPARWLADMLPLDSFPTVDVFVVCYNGKIGNREGGMHPGSHQLIG